MLDFSVYKVYIARKWEETRLNIHLVTFNPTVV